MWSNPGYMVSIDVQEISKKDGHSVEAVIKAQNYITTGERFTNIRCVWYKKTIITDKLIEKPYVKTAVCFNEESDSDMAKDFSILIMNEWQGQYPQLKQEIDSIADILIAELKKLVGEENIKVERKATGPPF